MPNLTQTNSYADLGYDVSRIELTSNSGGNPIDLKNLFIEIAIYESIFDHKIVGEVLLRDSLNLSESIPIVGNESIHIEYKTENSDQPYTVIDGKVFTPLGKARTENGKVEVYKLQFVSNMQFGNRTRRISGAYNGSITKIARQIFGDNFGTEKMSKLLMNDETYGTYKFIIPYWNPLFTMSWLAERAFSQDPSCFLFYEDVDGFHFKNILKSIQATPKMIYREEPMNPANMSDVMSFMSRVLDHSVTSFFDRLDEYSGGMYSGTLLTHDITRKKIESHKFDYTDSFFERKRLNDHPLLPMGNPMTENLTKNALAFRNVMPVQWLRMDKIQDNEKPEKYFLNRNSIQKQFTTMRVDIKVPGNSNLRLLDTVGFEIPKSGYLNQSDTEWQDQYLSGNYIITSLRTVINRTSGYTTTIGMAKDSLVKAIPSKFEKSNSNNV